MMKFDIFQKIRSTETMVDESLQYPTISRATTKHRHAATKCRRDASYKFLSGGSDSLAVSLFISHNHSRATTQGLKLNFLMIILRSRSISCNQNADL